MFRKLTLALVAAASLSADGAGSHLRFGGRVLAGITITTTTVMAMATASASASSAAAMAAGCYRPAAC